MNKQATSPEQGTSLASIVARLAAVIGSSHYSAGDRAALRRWALGQPVPLAFYRLWLRHLGTDLPSEQQTDAWMTLAWAFATLGEGAHDPKRSFGQALAESHYSEGRLERLLSASEDVRKDLFMGAVRFLAAKNERCDGRDMAQFLLTLDTDKLESLYRRIAAAYFRHLPHESKAKE
ncbi:MAG: type I-E CRISPR-associated protein Cse2/CasB [Sulfuriferula sp.]